MLDLEFIRKNQELVKSAIDKKQLSVDLDEFLKIDQERRKLITKRDELLAERNTLSIDVAKKRGPALKTELAQIEPQLAEVEASFQKLYLQIPQIPADDAPVGDESANRVVRVEGSPRDFTFDPKDHIELGQLNDLFDFTAGSKVGGFRGYYLKNEAVLLHHGLMQLGLKLMYEAGFELMVPPTVVREFALIGSGHFPFGRAEVYQVGNAARLDADSDKESHFLVGTAEPSLLAYFADQTLAAPQLPVRVCGISQCYRSEAGSYGQDTKGLYRVHEFMKVEQVVICEANTAAQQDHFDQMLEISEKMVKLLELPYRVVEIATGDMGAGKVKMYDLETWMPSRKSYGETHSNSALGDWQARRLKIRYKDSQGKTSHPFTLNNTVIASPRMLVALIENHQNEDGSINIPESLQQFVGKGVIGSKTE